VTTVVVTGTGTEVGKTYITAAALARLRDRGHAVRARKPVQSFDPADEHTDADVLAAASGEDPHAVCPPHRWIARAMAPPMAADALGLVRFTIADLASEVGIAPAGVITFVEGAGGLLSPLAADGDTRDLIARLRPELVVLVADAGLGTINLTRLCAAQLRPDHSPVVVLNRYDARDELHRANAEWLSTRECLEIVTDPEALVDVITAVRS
jgi:dethiobiotin synthetase